MTGLLQDITFAWRTALKQPITALLIVVTLALGIGANSAMFSAVWDVLLAPLPYKDGGRLVRLKENEKSEGLQNTPWSPLTLADYREQSRVFEDLIYYSQYSFTLVERGAAQQVYGGEVSWNFFDVLGIRPILGRSFVSGEDTAGAAPLVLLSHDFWVSAFGADPGVIGSSVEMNGLDLTIIGVLPEMPRYPHYNDVWITPSGNPYRVLLDQGTAATRNNSSWFDYVFGKLRKDVSLSEALLDVNVIARRLRTSYPGAYSKNYSVSLDYIRDEMVANSRTTFLLLLALAILIVLIAGANVASLNLARVANRNQELAIREALGARRGRIARQLFVESLFFALVGGLAGVAIAYLCLNLLADFASQYTPLAGEIRLNGAVFLFSLVTALMMGIASGCAAAFNQRNINTALKEGGNKATASLSGNRKRQALLAAQYALSFVILTTAALITFSLYRLNNQNAGYDPDQVLAASIARNVDLDADPQQIPEQIRSFGTRLLSDVSALPGVAMAGLLIGRPLLQVTSFDPPSPDLEIEGRQGAASAARPQAPIYSASKDYFRLMDIPLLAGRTFTQADDENSVPVAIVNEHFATRYFGSVNDAIGRRIKMPWQAEWRTIVGVVGNVRSRQLDREEGEVVYYDFRQFPGDVMNLYVKASSDLHVLARAIKKVVHDVDPRQSIGSIQPLNDIKDEVLAPSRLRATLISLCGFLALAVTLSGVIGVVSYDISQRVREIGIHIAVGADPAHIRALFISRGLKVYLLGLLIGLAFMLAAAPLLSSFLYKTSAWNAGIYLASAAVLSIAVMGAMYLPASRASRLSPVEALDAK